MHHCPGAVLPAEREDASRKDLSSEFLGKKCGKENYPGAEQKLLLLITNDNGVLDGSVCRNCEKSARLPPHDRACSLSNSLAALGQECSSGSLHKIHQRRKLQTVKIVGASISRDVHAAVRKDKSIVLIEGAAALRARGDSVCTAHTKAAHKKGGVCI